MIARRMYRHRVNTLKELGDTPEHEGIEFDLRSDGMRTIVTHDPFTDGPTIDEFFASIGPRPCIFNVKCEGIEGCVMNAAARFGITDYFFLDLSVPAAAKLASKGERRFAVRYSEWEPVESVLAWKGTAQWVWVDCFHAYPGDAATWARLSGDFRLCIVSPELQGHGVERIGAERANLSGRAFHAVCSKRPDLWGDR